MEMKKTTITLFILALFTSCGVRRTVVPDSTTFDEGVVKKGVRWATRNVDMPGTFAETPECFGMLFQWNRIKGWNRDERGWWDNRHYIQAGTEWEKANDPCPQGWRVPTWEELRSLRRVADEWITQNGVNGRLFGTAPNQIFLPATDWHFCPYCSDANDDGDVRAGAYWSSETHIWYNGVRQRLVHYLLFTSDFLQTRNIVPSGSLISIRCVAKN